MQGPFSAEEMAQWFSAGYFTMNLLVKRRCDQQFQPLGELIKRWGRVPFLPGAAPPPVVHSPLVISEPTETVAQPLPLHLPEITSMAPLQPALPVVTSTHTSNLTLPQGPGIGPDQLLVQQHLLLRNQLLQQQLVRQIQMQALAHLQLQEQEGFKTLDPVQQQHLNLQILQSHPLLLHQVQQLQQAQQLQVSQGQPQATIPVQPISQHVHSQQPSTDMDLSLPSPSFQRSISQPAASTERQGDMTSIWGTVSTAGAWSQPGSVWDLENDGASSLPKADIADIEKLRQEKETELARLAEEERRRQEEIQKQQEELRRQQEELQREREQVLREKEELERQKQMELQRLEEARRQHEERQRLEEVRRQHEEEQKRRELEEAEKRRWAEEEEKKRLHEEQRRKEEEKKRLEEVRWQEDKRKQEELRRKADEELALQELKRQEEMRQQEEAERQRQQMEIQKKQQEFQKQQQEALRRLQQQQREQLADIQLPPTANWARQQQQAGGPQQSLTEIQQEEQKRQQQLELKRQQMLRLQAEQLAQQQLQHQHQQQQQKSWASSAAVPQSARIKTLAEIQEEQAKQLQEEQEKITQQQQHHQQQQQQQQQTKNMGLSMAAVWGSGEPKFNLGSAAWGGGSVWGSETSMSLWGSSYNSTQPTPVSSNASVAKKSGKESTSQSSDFPALINRKSSSKSQSNNKPQPTKAMKEEEAVQRLFQQPAQKKDDFTVWCEAFLQGMDVTVDIETFVSFLQAVESPYEVHDYVRNYLGEGKDAKEFAKQFLEKRSQFKNKARMEKRQEEESIWGPAPAVTPREARRLPQQAPLEQNHGDGSKAKNKKKKKMQKMDGSNLLSFTVEKDPNRKNAGEIASLD
ncbi:GRB10-interacting GYF protein 2-like isoform X1 [Pomacea canaliculata]|uniref:GRB10-interacting GYF protein 2-like isoform X1 n=1 Tax=Pomacea canaliculata TaxID=400727 RepID=UPI000D735C53|nr:GRB10-interacting GYF protein 2-like isoform X1 [Pomacea canaliculata]